jgi:hypothetical protein
MDDDPIQAMPAPLPVNASPRGLNQPHDFIRQSFRSGTRPPIPAGAINTLGEVPDSEWFTNRHGMRRMSREELQRARPDDLPIPPFTITKKKSEGITPGFVMEDSRGRRYFAKFDPWDHPELSTGAEVITSNFLHAIGYNTAKNEIVYLKESDLQVSDTSRITLPDKRSRRMTRWDVEDLVDAVHRNSDGAFRIVAGLAVEGENVGPFRYEGTRQDDPNDIVPHENRRDLRGLYVFSAWLNNTDTKAGNTIDTVVEENGTRFIRHYLIDFGSSLGSNGDRPKDVREGHRFALPTPTEALSRALTLGLIPWPWELTSFPKLPAIGNFTTDVFDPDDWKPDYPNPAFQSRLPDDDFWAAKQVMAFSDDDIRTIVETGKYSDPRAAEYIVATLAKRRDMIGRTFFSKMLPLDHFRVEKGELLFDDLAVKYGLRGSRLYEVQWSRFDNMDRSHVPIPSTGSPLLPTQVLQAASGSYFGALIHAPFDPLKPVSIYLRKQGNHYKVVGVERSW